MVRICWPDALMTIVEDIAIYPIPAVIEIVPIARIMKVSNGLKINSTNSCRPNTICLPLLSRDSCGSLPGKIRN